jgi:hypothetical protein
MADTVRRLASGENDEDLDIIRFSSDAKPNPEAEKRVPLFFIDDVPYTVPKKPNPVIGLTFLKLAHEEGVEEANYYLLMEMLGEEGYQALLDYAAKGLLEQEHYDQVLEKALRIVSRQDTPKANNRNGTYSRRR